MNLWLDDQLVITLTGPEGRRELVVPRPFARIGGHPDSEVALTGPGVAKRALYLHATREGLFCLDLDAEDAVIEKRGRWLGPDDVMQVGTHTLTARIASHPPPSADPPPSPVAWGSATVPLPVLNVHCKRLLKDKRRFRARLNLIGRRPQCALQLHGARVSSFHCALFWDQRRLWCVDLLSSNGTQLNGAKLDCGEVLLNDRLDVGVFELVYHRWSPRRSMQPGWRPGQDAQDADHESAEGDELSPALDAAPPPSADAADLALADELDETGASDEALQHSDLSATRVPPPGMKPPIGPPKRPIGDPAIDRLRKELETAAAAQAAWEAERDSLSQQLAERGQQIGRLEAELKAAGLARSEQEAARARLQALVAQTEARLAEQQKTLSQHQAALLDRDAELARRGAELTKGQALIAALTAAKAQAEALAVAPREAVISPEQLRVQEQLQSQVKALTQERDALQAQWAESSQRFAAQIAQLNAAAVDLRQGHELAAAAQDDWRAERERLLEQTSEGEQKLAGVRAELAAAGGTLTQRQAELARVIQERNDLQAQWTAQAQQLAAQSERSREEAARAAKQRTEFDAQQQRWQAEQRALREQLADRTQQHARLEAELAAAAAELDRRVADVESLSREKAAMLAQAPLAVSSFEPAQSVPGETEPSETDTPAEEDAKAQDFFPVEPVFEEAPSPSADVAAQPEPAAPTPEGGLSVISGRRSKAQRQEMTTFIGDRLSALDHVDRRRRLLLWASVAAGTLVLSAVAFGVWYVLR